MFRQSIYKNHILSIAESTVAESPKPWILFAPTFNSLPPGEHLHPIFRHLLNKGISIVSLDIGENCGGNEGIKILQNLSDDLHLNQSFQKRFVVFGGSRGALDLYNFAISEPTKILAIAAVYPVTNLYDYPGKKIAKKLLKIKNHDKRALFEFNPIQNIYKLASYLIPIFHIHGNQDKTVSFDKNSLLVKKSYEHYGGSMDLQVIDGLGHEKSSLFFESSRLMDFIITHSLKYK